MKSSSVDARETLQPQEQEAKKELKRRPELPKPGQRNQEYPLRRTQKEARRREEEARRREEVEEEVEEEPEEAQPEMRQPEPEWMREAERDWMQQERERLAQEEEEWRQDEKREKRKGKAVLQEEESRKSVIDLTEFEEDIVPIEQKQKTITEIYELFRQCYLSQTPKEVPFETGVRSKPHEVFDLYVFEKRAASSGKLFYGLSGNALLHPIIRDLIPLNTQIDKNEKITHPKPRWFRKFWFYQPNPENREKLMQLHSCAAQLAQDWDKASILVDPPYLTNPKRNGILQWDVQCVLPQWMETLSQKLRKSWNPQFNPRIEDNVILFAKCGVPGLALAKSTAFLQKNTDKFDALFPGQVYIQEKKGDVQWLVQKTSGVSQDPTIIKEIIEQNYTTIPIGWTHHGRTLFIDYDTKSAFVIDPWMQHLDRPGAKGYKYFRILKNALAKEGFTLTFVPRQEEQGQEGACNALVYLRALLLSESGPDGPTYGVDGASMPIPCEYAILATRLLSRFRK